MALIPPFFMDCVVAIGIDKEKNDNKVDDTNHKQWIATGFLYGHYIGDYDNQPRYRVFLVTNRHVFKNLSRIYLRFNPQADESARDYAIDLLNINNSPIWITHPKKEIDIALIDINFSKLQEDNIQCYAFVNNKHIANIDKMNELGITEGDFVYVMGFPMGLVGEHRNSVIVRGGTIARIRDALTKNNQEFLVDAFIFPGNSGGPVISKPEATSIKGTKSQKSANLIGIIKSYVPYKDIAISAQTKQPRVIFEENSGLASAHPVDFIEDIISDYLKETENLDNILPGPIDQIKLFEFLNKS